MVSDFRHDTDFMARKIVQHAGGMLGCVVGVHSMVEWGTHSPIRDLTALDKAGTLHSYKYVREVITLLNLGRLAILENLNPGVEGIWARSLQGGAWSR